MSEIKRNLAAHASGHHYGHRPHFLHGHLLIEIKEAKDLPDMEGKTAG